MITEPALYDLSEIIDALLKEEPIFSNSHQYTDKEIIALSTCVQIGELFAATKRESSDGYRSLSKAIPIDTVNLQSFIDFRDNYCHTEDPEKETLKKQACCIEPLNSCLKNIFESSLKKIPNGLKLKKLTASYQSGLDYPVYQPKLELAIEQLSFIKLRRIAEKPEIQHIQGLNKDFLRGICDLGRLASHMDEGTARFCNRNSGLSFDSSSTIGYDISGELADGNRAIKQALGLSLQQQKFLEEPELDDIISPVNENDPVVIDIRTEIANCQFDTLIERLNSYLNPEILFEPTTEEDYDIIEEIKGEAWINLKSMTYILLETTHQTNSNAVDIEEEAEMADLCVDCLEVLEQQNKTLLGASIQKNYT